MATQQSNSLSTTEESSSTPDCLVESITGQFS